jgi:hypothetical protein
MRRCYENASDDSHNTCVMKFLVCSMGFRFRWEASAPCLDALNNERPLSSSATAPRTVNIRPTLGRPPPFGCLTQKWQTKTSIEYELSAATGNPAVITR